MDVLPPRIGGVERALSSSTEGWLKMQDRRLKTSISRNRHQEQRTLQLCGELREEIECLIDRSANEKTALKGRIRESCHAHPWPLERLSLMPKPMPIPRNLKSSA
jgi:hypothetical protein